MSLARKFRRQSSVKGKGKELQRAMKGAQDALETINKSELDKLPQVLEELQKQTYRASALADALADDYETLSEEIHVFTRLVEKIWERTHPDEDFSTVRDLLLEQYREEKERRALEEEKGQDA